MDCIRYQHELSLDVATEAPRGTFRSELVSAEVFVRTAQVCCARIVVQSYLLAIAV
jgi:hypothetical protein